MVIDRADRPRGVAKVIANDSHEDAVNCDEAEGVEYSRDKNTRWLKGHRCYFGYRSYARTDVEGYLDKELVRPANESEMKHSNLCLMAIRL